MPRYRRVNPEEREAINIVLSKRKLSQEDLAKSLHVSQAYLAQILSARRPLRKKYAEQIYKALEYDTSVEFLSLRNYREDFHSNPRDGFSGDVDAAWLNLYFINYKNFCLNSFGIRFLRTWQV